MVALKITAYNTAYAAAACSVPPQASAHICLAVPLRDIIAVANIAYAGTLSEICFFFSPIGVRISEMKTLIRQRMNL